MTAFHPIWVASLLFLSSTSFATLIADPAPLFSIHSFGSADFGSDFALLGDAKPANGGSRVNLTSSSSPSAGTLVFKNPFKLIDSRSGKSVSFSTDFVFSMSTGGHGDGLALIIVPEGNHSLTFGQGTFGISKDLEKFQGRLIAVEFGTGRGGHVGVDVGRFVSDEKKNASLLIAGEKLQSWVDYEANSKRLEIRLNKFGLGRPYYPLISFPIDLSRIWGEREVLLGIGSSSQSSAQITSVYSWSFRVRTAPNWLHSKPLDPHVRGDNELESAPKKNTKGNCALSILGGVIFATGCGTLVAFFVLLLWVVFFGSNLNGAAPEVPMKHLDLNYQKIDVNLNSSDSSDTSRMS